MSGPLAGLLRKLDEWIRRRLRAIVWTQWKHGRTRFDELQRRGVGRELALKTAGNPRGPWRLSNSAALTMALPNVFFVSRGLPYGTLVQSSAKRYNFPHSTLAQEPAGHRQPTITENQS
ncbi:MULTISPECIES: group II intron maturase-specific domain-containing protein [unclassified Bradyrhizobium]|uniref:group II intron maturase-specific domain-containing protein n=1 Tax=Bradyrhizobium TaxID=374 RepID=UPI0028E18755|nr:MULTISPECIES: group II intron maturase-specific domain-containing protein [unclassified Bradyrhizobium]